MTQGTTERLLTAQSRLWESRAGHAQRMKGAADATRGPRRSPRALAGLLVTMVLGVVAWSSEWRDVDARATQYRRVAIPLGLGTASAGSASPTSQPSSISLLIEPVEKSPSLVPIKIAFCSDERDGAVPSESEFIARMLGPHIFPPSRFSVSFLPVAALPSKLAKGVRPSSPKGLELLGLDTETKVRFCRSGTSQIVKWLSQTNELKTADPEAIRKRLQRAGLFEAPSSDGWMFNRTLRWPEELWALHDSKGRVRPPLLVRNNHEPLREAVAGSVAQLDCKRDLPSRVSATIYYPFILYSAVFRMAGDNTSYGRYLGRLPRLTAVKDIVLRPPGFNATQERLSKQSFASFAHRHCSGRRANYPSVWIRELFTFALAKQSGRAVHNVGECPAGDRGATRALLTVPERTALQHRFAHASSVEIHSKYKFAIVFENSLEDGYITEKIASAYLAQSLPVYWGPANSDDVLNPKAFLRCNLPSGLTSHEEAESFKDKVCASLGPMQSNCSTRDFQCLKEHGRLVRDRCASAYEVAMEEALMPHLERCADQVLALDSNDQEYDAMLREPLVPVDAQSGEPTGVWDLSRLGKAMFALYVGSGYDETL